MSTSPHPSLLAEQLQLADTLFSGRDRMLEPQDLPGRYGRVVRAIDRVLEAVDCKSVVGGGWAVWRHGFVGRVTQDVDIVLPADKIDEFLRVASVSGFQILKQLPGRWPKLNHRETEVQVDILPEGQHPGVGPEFAPTKIPSPAHLGATDTMLRYIDLTGLIELKIAAGRLKDKADIGELIRVNAEQVNTIRQHLVSVHPRYVLEFDALVKAVQRDDSPR